MQGGQGGQMPPLKIDQPGLMKVGLVLVIIGFVAGLLWLVGFLGGIIGILAWVVLAGAGWRYADVAIKDGKKLTLVDAGVNGAIIGGAVGLAYGLGVFIGQTIGGYGIFAFGFGFVVQELVSGAVTGAIAAAAWTVYKGGMIKTS